MRRVHLVHVDQDTLHGTRGVHGCEQWCSLQQHATMQDSAGLLCIHCCLMCCSHSPCHSLHFVLTDSLSLPLSHHHPSSPFYSSLLSLHLSSLPSLLHFSSSLPYVPHHSLLLTTFLTTPSFILLPSPYPYLPLFITPSSLPSSPSPNPFPLLPSPPPPLPSPHHSPPLDVDTPHP